jgi:hypothetical protein
MGHPYRQHSVHRYLSSTIDDDDDGDDGEEEDGLFGNPNIYMHLCSMFDGGHLRGHHRR